MYTTYITSYYKTWDLLVCSVEGQQFTKRSILSVHVTWLDLNLGVTGVMTPAKLVEEFNKWLDLNLGVTGVMAPAKLVEEFNKWIDLNLGVTGVMTPANDLTLPSRNMTI